MRGERLPTKWCVKCVKRWTDQTSGLGLYVNARERKWKVKTLLPLLESFITVRVARMITFVPFTVRMDIVQHNLDCAPTNMNGGCRKCVQQRTVPAGRSANTDIKEISTRCGSMTENDKYLNVTCGKTALRPLVFIGPIEKTLKGHALIP